MTGNGYDKHTFYTSQRLYNTWTSPNSNFQNQINFILTKQKWNMSVKNVKTLPRVNSNSDHEMFSATLKLKVVRLRTDLRPIIYETYRIKNQV